MKKKILLINNAALSLNNAHLLLGLSSFMLSYLFDVIRQILYHLCQDNKPTKDFTTI